jgi:plastocyanin
MKAPPALLALAALLTAVGTATIPAEAGTRGISFVQVVQKEFSLTLSRTSVRPGTVSVELVNFGMDGHDLVVLKHAPGAKPIRFTRIDPKTRVDRTLRLTTGRYALWCSIADHRARGMRATLVVR